MEFLYIKVFLIIIAGILHIYAALLAYFHWAKVKVYSGQYLIVMWFCWGSSYVLIGIGQLLLSKNLFYLATVLQIIGIFMFLQYFGVRRFNGINRIDFSLIVIVTVYYFLELMEHSEMFIVERSMGYFFTGSLRIIQSFFGLVYIYIVDKWMYFTYKNLVKYYKLSSKTKKIAYSMIILNTFAPIIYYFAVFIRILIVFPFIISSLLVVLFLEFFKKRPNLLYLYPYNMYSLVVIDKTSRTAIFKYVWNSSKINQTYIPNIASFFPDFARDIGFQNVDDFIRVRLENTEAIILQKNNTVIALFGEILTIQIIKDMERFIRRIKNDGILDIISSSTGDKVQSASEIHSLIENLVNEIFQYIPLVN